VDDIWFEYNFDAGTIPDGYWEMRAVAYNEYDQPGNVWRLRVRIENGPPAPPSPFIATPQADDQTVVLSWTGGLERDRAFYVLQRRTWDSVNGLWPAAWTNIASQLDPKASTYTDSGSVSSQVDPWGATSSPNSYQYRLWSVDICDPGNAGIAAQAEIAVPGETTTTTAPSDSTTTSASTTTTSAPSTTTTTGGSTTTTLAIYSVKIQNTVNKTYSILIKNSSGTTVYSGSVGKNATLTVPNLTPGNYQITASAPGRTTLNTSFSLPAQANQTVLTIL
jgi:hypothetical protein